MPPFSKLFMETSLVDQQKIQAAQEEWELANVALTMEDAQEHIHTMQRSLGPAIPGSAIGATFQQIEDLLMSKAS